MRLFGHNRTPLYHLIGAVLPGAPTTRSRNDSTLSFTVVIVIQIYSYYVRETQRRR